MNVKAKLVAVIETVLVFGLVAAGFHTLRQIELLQSWEKSILSGWPWLAYAALLLFTPAFLALTRRSFTRYGLIWQPVRYHLGIFGASFLPVFVLSVALSWIHWYQWSGALLVSILAALCLALTARLLQRQPAPPDIPGWLGGLAPLILFPLALGRVENALFSLAGAYLLIGPAEEMFFRGYAQSRLNQAFDRPFSTFGIRWGWGSLISAGLFGLWHVAWNPLAASAWPYALWTFFVGLIFSIVREKSGSVLAPALLHGVLNYGPQALLFDLFF